MNREDYITFIDGGTSDGVGFFVGNLFITAGHVFNEGQTHSIYFDGQRIVLDKNKAIFFNYPNGDFFSPYIPDVAIFDCAGFNSPLVSKHCQVNKERYFMIHSETRIDRKRQQST